MNTLDRSRRASMTSFLGGSSGVDIAERFYRRGREGAIPKQGASLGGACSREPHTRALGNPALWAHSYEFSAQFERFRWRRRWPDGGANFPDVRHRILVVEDEPAIAESVAYALERDGFGAAIAPTLSAAHAELGV